LLKAIPDLATGGGGPEEGEGGGCGHKRRNRQKSQSLQRARDNTKGSGTGCDTEGQRKKSGTALEGKERRTRLKEPVKTIDPQHGRLHMVSGGRIGGKKQTRQLGKTYSILEGWTHIKERGTQKGGEWTGAGGGKGVECCSGVVQVPVQLRGAKKSKGGGAKRKKKRVEYHRGPKDLKWKRK